MAQLGNYYATLLIWVKMGKMIVLIIRRSLKLFYFLSWKEGEILFAEPLEKAHIKLLKSKVRAFLEARRHAERYVRERCRKSGQQYKGIRSWPEELRQWRKAHATELLKLAKTFCLCRKYIKEEVYEFDEGKVLFEKERSESDELDLK